METPFNSEEGGYLYIWGGPYNASEELHNEFGSLVSERCIEEVVAEVEDGGISDWAPGPDHPDHEQARADWDAEYDRRDQVPEPEALDVIISQLEAGLKPRYGDSFELELRRDIIDRLDQLLHAMMPSHGGIGHNNPAPDSENPSVIIIDEVRSAAKVIGKELANAAPDTLRLRRRPRA